MNNPAPFSFDLPTPVPPRPLKRFRNDDTTDDEDDGESSSDEHDIHPRRRGRVGSDSHVPSDGIAYPPYVPGAAADDDLEDGPDPFASLIAQTLNQDGTPKRPMNAFMIFARRRRPQVSLDHPQLRTGEISKVLSKEWSTMTKVDKQFYLERAKKLKDAFNIRWPDYVYKRRPNNSRKKRKSGSADPTDTPPAAYVVQSQGYDVKPIPTVVCSQGETPTRRVGSFDYGHDSHHEPLYARSPAPYQVHHNSQPAHSGQPGYPSHPSYFGSSNQPQPYPPPHRPSLASSQSCDSLSSAGHRDSIGSADGGSWASPAQQQMPSHARIMGTPTRGDLVASPGPYSAREDWQQGGMDGLGLTGSVNVDLRSTDNWTPSEGVSPMSGNISLPTLRRPHSSSFSAAPPRQSSIPLRPHSNSFSVTYGGGYRDTPPELQHHQLPNVMPAPLHPPTDQRWPTNPHPHSLDTRLSMDGLPQPRSSISSSSEGSNPSTPTTAVGGTPHQGPGYGFSVLTSPFYPTASSTPAVGPIATPVCGTNDRPVFTSPFGAQESYVGHQQYHPYSAAPRFSTCSNGEYSGTNTTTGSPPSVATPPAECYGAPYTGDRSFVSDGGPFAPEMVDTGSQGSAYSTAHGYQEAAAPYWEPIKPEPSL